MAGGLDDRRIARSVPPEGLSEVLAGTPYRALRLMARGGMGDVYLAVHRELGQEVVIKVLSAELVGTSTLVERMRLEGQALAALHHPNIVAVRDFGRSASGRPFLVMDRLQGATLEQEVRSQGLPTPRRAVSDVQQMLAALAATHARGILHRDIKPSNVFAHRDAQGQRVIKLLDFGIAKVVDPTKGGPVPSTPLTADGTVVGTPRFLSPEQARAQRLDARADLYGVGLVLYYLLAGRGPFDHLAGDHEVIRAHLYETPSPPSRFAPGRVCSDLDAVVLRALAKVPGERHATARAFAEDLVKAAETLGDEGSRPDAGTVAGSGGSVGEASGEPTDEIPTRTAARLPARSRPPWLPLLVFAITVIVVAAAVSELFQLQ